MKLHEAVRRALADQLRAKGYLASEGKAGPA